MLNEVLKQSMNTKGLIALFILFLTGMLLRKSGINPGSIVVISSGLLLSAFLLYIGILSSYSASRTSHRTRLAAELFLGCSFLVLLCRLQYWLNDNAVSSIALLILVVYTFSLIRRNADSKSGNRLLPFSGGHVLHFLLLCTCWFGILSSLLLNPRQFHNFYRYSTYEEYTRSIYPEQGQEEANVLIERNKSRGPNALNNAKVLFKEAIQCEDRKDIDQALRKYNLAIDLDPSNAEYYFRRGFLKLMKLDIDNEMAWNAVVDFDRAVQLDPNQAQYWYNRGVALSYLDKKPRACADMQKAWSLDSSLDIKAFVEKCCPDSGRSFLKDANP